MSPLALRRFRAERMLREEFDRMRASVLATVRAQLVRSGVTLDESDLEACYATAWHGLYAAVLAGEQIESPPGWLVTVCFRRAIDEHRSRSLPGRRLLGDADPSARAIDEGDFTETLEAKERLLRLFEGIGTSMSARERQAACLCFLHGLSRAEAAREMGISARRMERLMDGRGAGRAGVARKLEAITETIAAGRFCEERESTMRALALGLLDPDGERHRLALAHQRSCPACRAYVLELRGLSVVLPPFAVPAALELLRGPAGLARLAARGGGAHAGAGAAARAAGQGAATQGGVQGAGAAARGLAASASQSGALMPAIGAKLAAAALATLALGGGAYALATRSGSDASHRPTAHASNAAAIPPGSGASAALRELTHLRSTARDETRSVRAGVLRFGAGATASMLALREFGFERILATSPARRTPRRERTARLAAELGAAAGNRGPTRQRRRSAAADRGAPAAQAGSAAAGAPPAAPTAAIGPAPPQVSGLLSEGAAEEASRASAASDALREFGIE
ncbi:MAG: sigma-70 family RNA polymerase sigma factor [Solirubrobacteraceae bacterium]